MDGITLTINESWDGDLEKELIAALRADINPALAKANAAVKEAMRDSLARHLETDMYGEYDPKMYERRGENGGMLGQAIHLDSAIAGMVSDSTRATINYKPSGDHPTVSGWHKVDGDDLIGRIEKHDPEYNWLPRKGKKIPNRPFWQNFVDEMVDSGGMEVAWMNAMLEALPDGWKLDMDKGVEREANDGSYG